MVKSLKELHGTAIEATDGNIGSVHDVYFDDQTCHIRYFVVDTAKLLPGRKVLIAPEAIRRPWQDGTGLPVNLTREQVKSSPDIEMEGSVSRAAELLLHTHYGWAPYWGAPVPPPPPPQFAEALNRQREAESLLTTKPRKGHIRSCRDVIGYQVEGTDAKAGSVADLLLDPEECRIRYLVIKLGEWLSHKQVLVWPNRIANVDWAGSKIHMALSRRDMESCPEYGSLVSWVS